MVFHVRFVKFEKTSEKHFNPLLPYLRISASQLLATCVLF